jgi:hypothetical protein
MNSLELFKTVALSGGNSIGLARSGDEEFFIRISFRWIYVESSFWIFSSAYCFITVIKATQMTKSIKFVIITYYKNKYMKRSIILKNKIIFPIILLSNRQSINLSA